MPGSIPDDPRALRRRVRASDCVLIGLLLAAIATGVWMDVPRWIVVMLVVVLVTAVVGALGNAGLFDRDDG